MNGTADSEESLAREVTYARGADVPPRLRAGSPHLRPGSGAYPPKTIAAMAALFLLGGAGFVVGLSGKDPSRLWSIYLVNFLFWTGLSQGAVLFVAVMNVTRAKWTGALIPTAAALAAFLPFSVILFALLVPGLTHVLPWISHGAGHRSWWLNLPFLACRNSLGFMALAVLGLIIVWKSGRKGKPGPTGASVAFILIYVVVMSVAAVDLVMSANPEWMNTLYPAHLFIGGFCLGLAGILVFSSFHSRLVPALPRPDAGSFRDLTNLTLGFALFTGYLFYTQVFVIWYGNLPTETQFLIRRSGTAFWSTAGVCIVLFCFALPLLAIPFGGVKRRVPVMALLGVVIMAGLWIERFVVVMPETAGESAFVPGFVEIAVTAGFLGLAGLSALAIGPSLLGRGEGEPAREERKGDLAR